MAPAIARPGRITARDPQDAAFTANVIEKILADHLAET